MVCGNVAAASPMNAATRGRSKLCSVGEEEDEDDDFMMRIVHGSCQGVFPTDSSSCQNVTCQMSDQLDLLTHCRQPLAFLSFFHEHRGNDPAGMTGVEVLPAGAYVMPSTCEYCDESDTRRCGPECTRPPLYFQKKRPPFAKPDCAKWDPVTDNAIKKKPQQVSPPPSPFEGSWVSGLFRGGGSPSPERT